MTNPKSQIENPQPEDWIEIGTIVASQGLKGEMRVYSNSDFPERFEEPGRRWLLRPNETEPQPVELLSGRYIPGKGIYIVQLAGVEDRNQADALRGSRLMVPASDRPILEEDEYHVLDLIGLEVFNQLTGETLGTVVEIIPAGNDLLEVQLHQAPTPTPSEAELDDPSSSLDSTDGKKQKKSSRPPTVLIPFVKEIVPVVDLEQRRIEITPPAGLLDLE